MYCCRSNSASSRSNCSGVNIVLTRLLFSDDFALLTCPDHSKINSKKMNEAPLWTLPPFSFPYQFCVSVLWRETPRSSAEIVAEDFAMRMRHSYSWSNDCCCYCCCCGSNCENVSSVVSDDGRSVSVQTESEFDWWATECHGSPQTSRSQISLTCDAIGLANYSEYFARCDADALTSSSPTIRWAFAEIHSKSEHYSSLGLRLRRWWMILVHRSSTASAFRRFRYTTTTVAEHQACSKSMRRSEWQGNSISNSCCTSVADVTFWFDLTLRLVSLRVRFFNWKRKQKQSRQVTDDTGDNSQKKDSHLLHAPASERIRRINDDIKFQCTASQWRCLYSRLSP